MRSELGETLVLLDRLSRRAEVVPILFGTAVLEIMDIGDFNAADVDVIVEAGEGRALAAVAGIGPGEGSGNDKFSSVVHLHLSGAPLIIDVMAGMSVHGADGWARYEVQRTVDIEVGGHRFRAASLADLKRFYHLAGRAKDDAKIAALEAYGL